MSSISADLRLPLYQQLRDKIAKDIADNRWKPGEALPTEQALASQLSLSTGTVRKAISLLVSEGILEKQQGRGTYIRRPQFTSSMFRFFRFHEFSGEKTIPDSEILSIKVTKPSSYVAKILNIQSESSTGICIHRLRTVAGKPLMYEEIWLPYDPFCALLKIDLSKEGPLLYPLYEFHCGQVVASADEVLTVGMIEDQYSDIMKIPMGNPIIIVERTARDFAGRALEWRRTLGNATHFSYSVQVR